jgi:hypothetical protein
MSASGTVDSDASSGSTRQLVWASAPFGRDYAMMMGWSLAAVVLAYLAIIVPVFGVSALHSYLLAIPAVLAFAALVEPFTFMPAFMARRVGVDEGGFVLIRFRAMEAYPWNGVKPGYRPPRTWPFIGHLYPLVLSGGTYREPQFVGLTRPQAGLVAAHFGKTVEEVWLPRRLAKERDRAASLG